MRRGGDRTEQGVDGDGDVEAGIMHARTHECIQPSSGVERRGIRKRGTSGEERLTGDTGCLNIEKPIFRPSRGVSGSFRRASSDEVAKRHGGPHRVRRWNVHRAELTRPVLVSWPKGNRGSMMKWLLRGVRAFGLAAGLAAVVGCSDNANEQAAGIKGEAPPPASVSGIDTSSQESYAKTMQTKMGGQTGYGGANSGYPGANRRPLATHSRRSPP